MNNYSKLETVDRTVTDMLGRYALPGMRLGLGVTYVWFGLLKVLGISPVAELVAKTAFFVPKKVVVPLMGLWEMAIGLGLLFRVALRVTLLSFFLQIGATFMTFLIRPDQTFQDGNPLKLTKNGEFIVKNLVLLAAGAAVGSTARQDSEPALAR